MGHASKVAEDFRLNWEGKLDGAKLENAAERIEAEDVTAYPAHGAIVSMIFYLKVQVTVDEDQEEFNGSCGGAATPGGGALIGNVYTDDLAALYANTTTIELNATSVYTSVLFFDDDSNLLGNFEAGAISTVNGIAGGSGEWSAP
jgi:hypothetical protein